MLVRIDASGHAYEVKKVPYASEYKERLSRLSPKDFKTIWKFLESGLKEDFSVGIKYTSKNREAWDGPLHLIWESTGRDALSAGYFLGLIMMDVVIQDKHKWVVVKSGITRRDFETNFYFRPS